MGAVVLLLELLAGEDGLFGVDDDDIVAAVHVGGVVDLQLAAEQVGRQSGGLAQGLPAASITYHLRVTVSLFSMVVDISCASSCIIYKFFDKSGA